MLPQLLRRGTLFLSVVLMTSAMSMSIPAFASGGGDSAGSESAQQQFDLGRSQVRAGRCDLAVESFRASIAAAPNVGAWLNLGDCLERLDQFQDAYEAQRAGQALAAERRDDRVAVARESAERIQAKVVTLVVSMPPAVYDLELSVDGKAIPRERWSAILVSPSENHLVIARGSGVPPFSQVVSGRAGDAMPIAVRFDRVVGGSPPVAHHVESAAGRESGGTSALRTVGFVTMGVGVAAEIGAGVFGALASSARSDLVSAIESNPGCTGSYPNERCDISTRSKLDPLHDRIDGRATVSTAFFIGGLVCLAGGLAMILLAPSSQPKTARAAAPGFVW